MTYHVYHDNGHGLEIKYSYKPALSQPILAVDSLEELVYENDVMITASTCSYELVIKDGFITLGNAKFPINFHTKGLNETLSAFGQFFMSVELFLEDL